MNLFWIYNLPNWLFATILICSFVALSIGGLIATRPLARRIFGNPPAHNEIVGDILQAASAFYGITLGLIAIGAWSTYSDAQTKVSREAAALGALYRDATMFPEPYRKDLTEILREYTRQTIDVAWPLQRHGEIPKGGVVYMDHFQTRLAAFRPANIREQVLMQEIFHQYNAMMELRRLRLDSVTTGMLPVIWFVVLAGAAVNILLACCFVMKRVGGHVLLVTLLTSLIAMLLFLTAAMDHPFRGRIGIGPEAFELIYTQLMKAP